MWADHDDMDQETECLYFSYPEPFIFPIQLFVIFYLNYPILTITLAKPTVQLLIPYINPFILNSYPRSLIYINASAHYTSNLEESIPLLTI